MATALSTIKNWFKTGLFPTQTQFWATWDSFWHKDEEIPTDKITGLMDWLNSKADTAQLSAKLDKGQYDGTAEDIVSLIGGVVDAFVEDLESKTDKGGSDMTTQEVIEFIQGLPKPKITHLGEFQIFKRNGNQEDYLEPNDYVIGIVEGIKIEGVYLNGDPTVKANFDIVEEYNF